MTKSGRNVCHTFLTAFKSPAKGILLGLRGTELHPRETPNLPFFFSQPPHNIQDAEANSLGMVKAGPRNGDTAATINPTLILGPVSATASTFISTAGVTNVLSIGQAPRKRSPEVVYHRLFLTDSPNADLNKILDQAIAIIDNVANANGIVLVHCSAGISRSPSVITGYLMKVKGMTLRSALGLVIQARPAASPNSGFLHCLQKLDEELHGTISLDVEELPKKREDKVALFKDT
ncbi:hypothetical protein FRB93_007456 [Tulasnella sp. JGI-2019a]|nr:hypothetical protein FRB93_007456 [Tulasnella sp. JGI-2019a]